MISKGPEVVETRLIAADIGGAQIGREEAKDIGDCNFVLDDLRNPLFVRAGSQVLVTPGMTTDLVAIVEHTLHNCWISCGRVVNLSLGTVISHDEEGRFDTGSLEGIEDLGCVDVRPVVECQGNFTRSVAMVNVNAVRDIPKQGTRSIAGVMSDWTFVSITSRSRR